MNYKKNFFLKLCVWVCASVLFINCSSDDDNSGNQSPSPDEDTPIEETSKNYFVGIEYSDSGDDYLSSIESLKSGEATPVGNGFEQLGWSSFIQGKDQIFGLVGNNITSYQVFNGKLEKGKKIGTDLGTYAWYVVDESTLVAVGSPWYAPGIKKLYLINTDNMEITTTEETSLGDIFSTDPAEVHISMPTDAAVVNNKLFVSYYLFDGDGNTTNVNEARIAVYSYPELKFEKLISDERAPNIGRYFTLNAMEKDENGDIYTVSTSSLVSGFAPVPATNSGILRIKSGATEFDKDYHIDFETLSKGYKLNDLYYVGNGKAVVRVAKEDETLAALAWAAYSPISEFPVLEFGIIDLYNETFKLLPNIPKSSGGWFGSFLVEDTKVYVGVNSKNYSDIYVIDVDSETATKGATVDGNYAKAILAL